MQIDELEYNEGNVYTEYILVSAVSIFKLIPNCICAQNDINLYSRPGPNKTRSVLTAKYPTDKFTLLIYMMYIYNIYM